VVAWSGSRAIMVRNAMRLPPWAPPGDPWSRCRVRWEGRTLDGRTRLPEARMGGEEIGEDRNGQATGPPGSPARGLEERDVWRFIGNVSPAIDPLRGEQRFTELPSAMNLEGPR